MERLQVLDCEFDSWDTPQTLENIEQLISRDERGYLCTVNVSILMMLRSEPRLAKMIKRAKMVVADGQPIIWVSKYLKKPLPERVTGVDLVEHLAHLAEKNKLGVYFLGAKEQVIRGVIEKLLNQYPKLVVSGYCNGYYDKDNVQEEVEIIKQSGAKILIVAMGVPRQEYFIDEHWDNLGVNFAIGVGGSFDVMAGFSRRAPLWMQKLGLEWLFRMLQEPRRLFKRYLTTNSLFIYLFFKEIVFGIKRKTGE